MKTIKMLPCLLFMFFTSCTVEAQKGNTELLSENSKEIVVKNDTLSKPKITVRVNKQLDDKGRIVKYDSTYSYFYSSPKGILHKGNDSIYSSFRSFFDKSYSDLMDRKSNDIFFNDSLFKYDFFNDNYFEKRFEMNEKMFKNMYQQMDSIKRDYLKQNYPDGYQKKKTK